MAEGHQDRSVDECGPKCRSRRHLSELFTTITLSREHEELVLNYLQAACRRVNVVGNTDLLGRTALHCAAAAGRRRIVAWLTLNEAQLGQKDDESGYTALHRAAYFGRLNVVRHLVMQQGPAALLQWDNDNLTCLDHFVMDRPVRRKPETPEPCEAYLWGSNSNYSLGFSNQQSRDEPELLEALGRRTRPASDVVGVAMAKFHTVLVTRSGHAYACGHGHGGRLGLDGAATAITPRRLKPFVRPPGAPRSTDPAAACVVAAAVGVDHSVFLTKDGTVWTCGRNPWNQLGHTPPPKQLLTPKAITEFIADGRSTLKPMTGVGAGRFHSVFWNDSEVYTCGLNGGQLGHRKGDRSVATPRRVPSTWASHGPAAQIVQVAASDAATAVLTGRGEVWVLHEFQCRSVASRTSSLEAQWARVALSGGQLDASALPEEERWSASPLQVVLLTTTGQVFMWSQSNPLLTQCLFRSGRQLVVSDVALSATSILLVSQWGEAFSGTLVLQPQQATGGRKEAAVARVFRSLGPSTWTSSSSVGKERLFHHVKVRRVAGVTRATAAACDPDGKNFAVLQTHPSLAMAPAPQVPPSQLAADYGRLLDEADVNDNLHDIVFQVGGRQFAAHRFVLRSRQAAFYQRLCRPGAGADADVVSVDGVPADVFRLVLEFVYTGTGPLLAAGPCRLRLPQTPKPGKSSKDGGLVALVRDCSRRLGVDELAERLAGVRLVDDHVTLTTTATTTATPAAALALRRCAADDDLCDVRLRSADGKDFAAHRVVLAARLEYFHSMFTCGWIETKSDRVVSLPLHSTILEAVLDYLYEDHTAKVERCEDIEWLCNLLVGADHLLISRLVVLCETSLLALLSLRNVGQVLQFAHDLNATTLRTACMQFICLNLAEIVELGSWNGCSDDVMDDLSDFYRQRFLPDVMAYRCVTPSGEAPSVDEIGRRLALLEPPPTTPPAAAASSSSSATSSSAKSRRRSGRKERQLSTSSVQSGDSVDVVGPEVAPSEPAIAVETSAKWSTVGRPRRAAKGADRPPPTPPAVEETPAAATTPPANRTGRVDPAASPTGAGKPSPTFAALFEAALVGQTSTSPASKKFPKLSQRQRKMTQSAATVATPAAADETPPRPAPNPWKSVDPSPASDSKAAASAPAPLRNEPAAVGSPSAPPPAPMRRIIASELHQERNTQRLRTKPLKLTLIEEAAMDDLRHFYQADDCDDELIVVERVAAGPMATPIWRTALR